MILFFFLELILDNKKTGQLEEGGKGEQGLMLCESQPASEEERSQGPTGTQEESGCASMPEGAVSPARNSSCLPGCL